MSRQNTRRDGKASDDELARRAHLRDAERDAKRRPHKPEKRGYIDETNTGADYSADETDALIAVDAFRLRWGRQFPTVCEILAVLVARGWRRTGEVSPMPEAQGPRHKPKEIECPKPIAGSTPTPP